MVRSVNKPLAVYLGAVLALLCWLASCHFQSSPGQELFKKSNSFSRYGSQHLARDVVTKNASAASFAAAAGDDDHTCSAIKPCSNKACCGVSGVCGYGPDYCGTGCQSNCDAHAECGKYSAEPGKKCPLNVCCSEFGFCGTTEDFCNSKCQSNCILHPEPPKHDKGDVLKRVIGYYEGWNAQSKCHETKPTDLPLSALTHINFAFAFVEPTTFKIVPMTDGKTSVSLFGETTALKSYNPSLKIFVSVGGWTFSDNGTATQPLLGQISASGPKRRAFAANVVSFLHENGFDGLDLDWEYPGAPDRGGDIDDTENMVKLFADIRAAFKIPGKTMSSRSLFRHHTGIFDGLTYLMSYDIHGLWDRDSEIGSIVQPHTNLTEIQRAAELLWRIDVPPSKVALGLGFYGRSFTLADPSCNKPGCRFKDASRPGVCTNTGGFLAYYEIEDILAKNKDISLQHDKDAAVKYFSWDKDQWISFDDKETFAQKVKWANGVGMSGVLLWASDLDDYTFSAHSGLLGKTIKPNNQFQLDPNTLGLKATDLTNVVTPEYHKDCYRFESCVDPDIQRCDGGYTMVGNDKSDCGDDPFVKPICCKSTSAPKSCTWRGGGADCNGQCHPGEVTLFGSSKGGGPKSESGTKRCNRGGKAFCCTDERFTELTETCAWTNCGVKQCKDDEWLLAYAENLGGNCDIWSGYGMRYCCKAKIKPFDNCHWVGQGDCAENTCDNKETTLATDVNGNNYGGKVCNWGRKASLCCTPNLEIFAPATCDKELCKTDNSYRCGMDPHADIPGGPDECDPETEYCSQTVSRRWEDSLAPALFAPGEGFLEKRKADREPLHAQLVGAWGQVIVLLILSRRYPGSTHLHDTTLGSPASNRAYRPTGGSCDSTAVEDIDASSLTFMERLGASAVDGNGNPGVGPGYDTEHNPDLQYARDFLQAVASGRLLGNTNTVTRAIDGNVIENYWNITVAANTFPRAGKGARDTRSPSDYFMDQFGSTTNREPLLLTHRPLNIIKGQIFDQERSVQAQGSFNDHLTESVNTGAGEDRLLEPIRLVISVFRYINHSAVLARIQANRRNLRAASQRISQAIPALSRLYDLHREFDNHWYRYHTQRARDWVVGRIEQITEQYHLAEHGGATIANARRIEAALVSLWADLTYITAPPDIP